MKKNFFILIITIFSINILYADYFNSFIKKIDFNKDEKVSKQEMEQYSLLEFRKADINKDNKLNKDEFYNHICQNSCDFGNCMCKNVKDNNFENLQYFKDYWDRINTNKDKYISINEKLNSDMNDFLNLDMNLDNFLTEKELKEVLIKNE